ncbi:unnamed protein product [Caenorhabditis auriculariae]|uniref:Uncharacterized protein n=1 Tax=Caenorhabditis auriculariae TaxID=2777116 RepID=A0A8S1HPM1_9PELO|nr:unnamed protein product [Caenorhabditis auriculariae]
MNEVASQIAVTRLSADGEPRLPAEDMGDNALDTKSTISNKSLRKASKSLKSHRSSSSSSETKKFHAEIDGLNALIEVVQKLGKSHAEMQWHDVRKGYVRETGRHLTVEEMNTIFGVHNVTKHDIFELPAVKALMTPVEGSRLMRFKLNSQRAFEAVYEIKMDSHSRHYWGQKPQVHQKNTVERIKSVSPVTLSDFSSIDVVTSPTQISSPIDDIKRSPSPEDAGIVVGNPQTYGVARSDFSGSFSEEAHGILSHQASLQSSITEDEGWISGQARSDNSSPLENKDDDEVFEKPVEQSEIKLDTLMEVDPPVEMETKTETIVKCVQPEDNLETDVVFDTIRAAEPVAATFSDKTVSNSPVVEARTPVAKLAADITLKLSQKETAEPFKVKAAPRKFVQPQIAQDVPEVAAEETVQTRHVSTPPPVRDLIARFEVAQHAEPSPKPYKGSANESVYARLRDEFGITADTPPAVHFDQASFDLEEAIDAERDEAMDSFIAEHSRDFTKERDDEDAPVSLKEQNSVTSVDHEYFYNRCRVSDNAFQRGASQSDSCKSVDMDEVLEKIHGNPPVVYRETRHIEKEEDGVTTSCTEDVITVVERKITIESQEFETKDLPTTSDALKQQRKLAESDGDIPYSIGSEDEEGPLTTADGQRADKVISVSVELDPQAKKREVAVDVPKEDPDFIENDEDANVSVLNRTLDLQAINLPQKPDPEATLPDGSVRPRRRGILRRPQCCLVM